MPDESMPTAPTAPAAPAADLIRGMLAASGVHPSPEEIETMTGLYAGFRAAADRLYPLVYDDDPAPVFDPATMFRAGRDV